MLAAVILADVSNECLFVELEDVVNYTVRVFLHKMAELCICLNLVLRS